MKYIILFLIFIFFQSYSYSASYALTGSFPAPNSKAEVTFTLNWKENKGEVEGFYSDDYFASSVPIHGAIGDESRIFRIPFTDDKKGVSAITIMTSQKSPDAKTNLPYSIVTQDSTGNPLTVDKLKGTIIPVLAQAQEARPCEEGFGELSNYCGLYEGMITEEVDPADRCDLVSTSPPRLELTEDGSLLLHIGPVTNLVDTPTHPIGRISYNPENSAIDVMDRECRPLIGVAFPGDNCKRLNLVGTFLTDDDQRRFTGVYSITDEATDLRCSYRLSFNKIPTEAKE
jgi:hypothetical protein